MRWYCRHYFKQIKMCLLKFDAQIFISIFVLSSIITSTAFAANQGAVSRVSSASLNISIHVPHRIGLFVKKANHVNKHTYCISVVDTRRINRSHIYKIHGVSGSHKKVMLLRNHAINSIANRDKCRQNMHFDLSNDGVNKTNNTPLFVLVPE